MTLKRQVTIRAAFPLSSVSKVINAICEDGKQRTAFVTAEPDTFFSIPARVYVKGKTVSGFLSRETIQGFDTETPDDPAVWKFTAYSYGKNGHLLKGTS